MTKLGKTVLEATRTNASLPLPFSSAPLTPRLPEFLNFRSSQLLGPIPTQLGQLTLLETLLLEGNWLSGTIPTELGNLYNIGTCSCLRWPSSTRTVESRCSLSHFILFDLVCPPPTEQMSFHRNYLSGRISAEICELTRFHKLTEIEVDRWIECACCA